MNDPSQTTPCSEYFQVSQPGRVQCNCTTFAPIAIGATFPKEGAAVGTLIGTYNNGTCPVGTITIVGTNGLQASASGGKIKLTSAIGYYEDGRDFEVSFKFTDKTYTSNDQILICVKKDGNWIPITAYQGEPAAKFVTNSDVDWVDEHANILGAYPEFLNYVQEGTGRFVPTQKNDLYFDRIMRNE